MPFQVCSHPVELPDLLIPDVLEFSNTMAQPLFWFIPARSLLVKRLHHDL